MFLENLAKTVSVGNFKWEHINDALRGYSIKLPGILFDPITAAAYIKTGKIYKTSEFEYAASELNMYSYLFDNADDVKNNPRPTDVNKIADDINDKDVDGELLKEIYTCLGLSI